MQNLQLYRYTKLYMYARKAENIPMIRIPRSMTSVQECHTSISISDGIINTKVENYLENVPTKP